ncbi:MAG: NADH-quinone oxidoreductase subunit J [Planctomycetia bacterium]|nr:NADH-quinone oxidoreductase subunit J [Planctomycetia bacterium]
MSWHALEFYFLALMACAFALAVVFAANVVRMAFYLILSLGATAGLFFLAGADFVGAMQLMMYVGGTLVLLVFGVMLTAQGPWVSIRTSGGEWVLAALVGGSLLAVLVPTAMRLDPAPNHEHAAVPGTAHKSENKAPDAKASTEPQTTRPTATRIGLGLIGAPTSGTSGYLLPFEAISIHLLVVLIGAAYLARPKRRARPKLVESDEA